MPPQNSISANALPAGLGQCPGQPVLWHSRSCSGSCRTRLGAAAGRPGTVTAMLLAELGTSPAKGHVSHGGFESAAWALPSVLPARDGRLMESFVLWHWGKE